jgi:hypothetical protein
MSRTKKSRKDLSRFSTRLLVNNLCNWFGGAADAKTRDVARKRRLQSVLLSSRTESAKSDLSLPGPCDRAVLTTRRGRGPVDRAVGRTIGIGVAIRERARHGRTFEVLHLNESLLARVPARSATLARLLVGRNVERDEEQQVRAQNANSRKCRKLFTGTPAHVRCRREIGGREVGVGSEVDKS